MTPISGKIFQRATTSNSIHAHGKIELYDGDDTCYRIDVSELLTLIQEQKWNLIKKTKYQHLVRAK